MLTWAQGRPEVEAYRKERWPGQPASLLATFSGPSHPRCPHFLFIPIKTFFLSC